MDSNYQYYTLDLNEDQNNHPFFSPLGSSLHDHQQHLHHHHHASFNPSSSSSLTSPSLSYLPFLINSHQDQLLHVGYNNNNNNTFHGFLDHSQSLETNKFVPNGGSSSSDQMVPKKETRLKLTKRKKDNHQDQIETETNSLKWISSKVRMMKKKKTMVTTTDKNKQHVNNNQSLNLCNLEEDHLKKIMTNQYENGYNGSNNGVVRICSDCNTTKTPLWRSGPRGPKSLCNACGIRQRKARQAAMATAAATATSVVSPHVLKKKMQNKNKRSDRDYTFYSPKVKICKKMTTSEEEENVHVMAIARDLENQSKSAISSYSSSKFYCNDDLAIILSKSSAYQQVFPQDEKEAAILLMALSYGMVHG